MRICQNDCHIPLDLKTQDIACGGSLDGSVYKGIWTAQYCQWCVAAATIEKRQNEPNVDFKDVLKDLKDSGKL